MKQFFFFFSYLFIWASPVAWLVKNLPASPGEKKKKNLPAVQETQV